MYANQHNISYQHNILKYTRVCVHMDVHVYDLKYPEIIDLINSYREQNNLCSIDCNLSWIYWSESGNEFSNFNKNKHQLIYF